MRSRDAKIECTKFMRRYSGDPLYAGFASKRHDSSRIPRCSSCSSRGSLFLRSHRPQRVRSRTRISWGSRWPRAQRQRAMSMPLPGSCARAIEPKVMFARGPAFAPLTLHTQTDHDGQLVTDVTLSPDGRFVAFVTGLGFVEGQAHTPAGLIPAPMTTVRHGRDEDAMEIAWTSCACTHGGSGQRSALGGDDQLVFLSEHDGWARLYKLPVSGGSPIAWRETSAFFGEQLRP